MFIRKVKTKSGAIAVQLAYREAGRDVVMKHFGSARNDQQLEELVREAKEKMLEGQSSLFDPPESLPPLEIITLKTASVFLYQTLAKIYEQLNFASLNDNIFQMLVLARLIEPTSKLDTIRVLDELGLSAPSNTSLHRCLSRMVTKDYRSYLATACVGYCRRQSPRKQLPLKEGLSLLLYDVTTLYFESQQGDDFRKPGLSKERRLDPQIVVGLLVNRDGFPLEISEFEGSQAETKTIVPVLENFYQKHHLDKSQITITADAGMLSFSNLSQLEDKGFYFIVGSRIAKTPYQIKEYQKAHPDEQLKDQQIFVTRQSFGLKREEKRDYRVIYQYRAKRAGLDLKNLEKQIAKAKRIISGTAPLKKSKFLQVQGATKTLDEKLILEHRLRAGIKGYVTNLPSSSPDHTDGVSPQEIINAYHQLFQVEKSFRMSKSDLKARPIFHHKLDSIKAHLTIVFAALAIARYIETHTHLSIKKFIQTLKVIRTPTVKINNEIRELKVAIPSGVENLIQNLGVTH
jgi:transposase